MRKTMGHTEVRVWACLKARQLDGWKFRRQHPIGPYFVDFCCPAARLIVEVNGPAHDDDAQWEYDVRRQAWLESLGYRVVRVNVSDIDDDLTEVTGRIYAELLERERIGFTRKPPPSPSGRHLPMNGEDYMLIALL
jgi:very-short-patch-repair endonuclease